MSKETRILTLRLESDLFARLTLLAKLAAMSVTELTRWAIEDKLAQLAADPQITDRADDLRTAIEREAAEQRDALNTLFSAAAVSDHPATPAAPTTGAKATTSRAKA